MAYKRIGEYGVVGNGVTVALVGRDGSIDWMCLPVMDSPSVFGALLDEERGGRFSVAPCSLCDSSQKYVPKTNILETRFRTAEGEMVVTDFMPVGPLLEEHPLRENGLLRRIGGWRGDVRIRVSLSPRFQYGKVKPEWSEMGARRWALRGGEEILILWASRELRFEEESAEWTIREGETLWLSLTYGEPPEPLSVEEAENLLRESRRYWEGWIQSQELGKYPERGYWEDTLNRTALVLKLLQFEPTGAIAAAATTSLPAIIYGTRNWDYRFSWIRDTAMTFTALFELGHVREVSQFFDWLKELMRSTAKAQLKVMYQLTRPELPEEERTLPHLSGYKESSPVQVGQHNVHQVQHDIYGELMDMIFRVSRCVGKLDMDDWEVVRPLVDYVAEIWREKDHGIWEMRTGPHHDTHSKVMCWVALDRGIIIAEHYGFPADLSRWKEEREAVRADVLEHGYSQRLGRFRQHYETDAVDSALLRIPLVDFLPATDDRVVRTVQAVEEELFVDGLVRRYTCSDGLPGQEQGFLICYFWYLRCLIRQGRLEEVDGHLRKVHAFGNDLGLFGEQFDPLYREITGNYPQALSHIGLATTILEFLEARQGRPQVTPPTLTEKLRLWIRPCVITPPEHRGEEEHGRADPSRELHHLVTLLQGEFYDGHRQRVDYALIRGSEFYRVLLKAIVRLRHFDPAQLVTDEERIAFWTNVFNTLVIHGVIELGIRDSIKEVPLFFERVQYEIGGRPYALADIEHGILRANAKPPHRFRRRFSDSDPRLRMSVRQVDPRIHFALVCASRTCPPIEAYDAAALDDQLESSGRVFINGNSTLDIERQQLTVPVIFKWYESDFAGSRPELIRFIARYWYEKETRDWLVAQADGIALKFAPYDWRLNAEPDRKSETD